MKEQQEALHRAPATDSTLDADAARALIFPLYEGRALRTGEPFADHAEDRSRLFGLVARSWSGICAN